MAEFCPYWKKKTKKNCFNSPGINFLKYVKCIQSSGNLLQFYKRPGKKYLYQKGENSFIFFFFLLNEEIERFILKRGK